VAEEPAEAGKIEFTNIFN